MVKETQAEQWVATVSSKHRWLDLHVREVWEYRDLIFLFVRRDFAAAYKQTILGPFWHLFSALASSAIYTLIFSGMANLPTDGLPPFLFYLSGQLAWSFFSECFRGNSSIFVANAGLFGKVYFPRLVMPFTTVTTAFFHLLIRLGVFALVVIIFLFYGTPFYPSWWMATVPLLLIMTALMGMGLGFFSSALTAKYRDLQMLISIGMTLLLYSSPVIYPASMVPEQYVNIYFLNPLAPVVEAFRYALLGAGTFNISRLGYSLGFTAAVFLGGLILFNKVERNFMDTV